MKTDVLILGGGPGGSAAAMFLLERGIRPLILEKESFPRCHVGESMAGEAAQLLGRLGLSDAMSKTQHPVKHGAKVLGGDTGSSWFVPVCGRAANRELIPGTAWQVRRSEFDAMMLGKAEGRGATVVRGTATGPLRTEEGALRGVTVRWPDGRMEDIESEMTLDCSGMATFLANHGVTGPKYVGNYDKQIALFAHVTGAIRDSGTAREEAEGNTIIFYKTKYHWAWFIPVDKDVVSIGLVLPAAKLIESGQDPKTFFCRALQEINENLRQRIAGIEVVDDVHVIPNYSYQVRRFCGKGFICIGDAHRFIDPIFSFGLAATLREAEFAVPHVCAYLEGKGRDEANPFAGHQRFCEKGIDVLEDMIDLFWERPLAFAVFVHHRFRVEMIDAFAGRVYESDGQPSAATMAFREMLNRTRSYEHEDDYSVPIGSRFHPERALLWEANSPLETTEEWMTAH